MAETLERERLGRIEVETDNEPLEAADEFDLETGIPPIFGRCPVCKSPLFPRDKVTGEPKAPPVGTGYDSRARCTKCGAIIHYKGNGNWGVLRDEHLTDEDRAKDAGG